MLMIKLVDAQKEMQKRCADIYHNEMIAKDVYTYLCDGLEKCEAVEQERQKGEWIWNDEMKCFLCSECERGWREQPTLNGKPLFEWCPVCGADMRGEEE